jgi:ferredoxin
VTAARRPSTPTQARDAARAEQHQPVRSGRPRRLRWAVGHGAEALVDPLGRALFTPKIVRLSRFLPSLPFGRHRPPRTPWPAETPPIPAALRGVPGIVRDPRVEAEAARVDPLQEFQRVHAEAMNWANRMMWRGLMPAAPALMRAMDRAWAVAARAPARAPAEDDAPLTRAVKEAAARIGLSAIGIAAYDPRYTFAPFVGKEVGDRIIVCVLEQSWTATQRIPSASSEKAAVMTYAEVIARSTELAAFIQQQGYRARPQGMPPRGVVIHYGVEAGLGQLGLNGQLLTPAAGSRCRIVLIETDAPLELDRPVDYGVHAICDACQACVRRCPSGAIPAKRRMHRGVLKAKINTARCLPVVAQVSGCAVCMRVCPVQRYGLAAVLEEFARTGAILGRGTDDLEGYDWPLDGRHYGPDARPQLRPNFFAPPAGVTFDFTRKIPVVAPTDTTVI